MTNTIELKKLIEKRGLKLQYLAQALGISRYTLNNKIENRSQFKVGEIKALCELLGIESLSERERLFFA